MVVHKVKKNPFKTDFDDCFQAMTYKRGFLPTVKIIKALSQRMWAPLALSRSDLKCLKRCWAGSMYSTGERVAKLAHLTSLK